MTRVDPHFLNVKRQLQHVGHLVSALIQNILLTLTQESAHAPYKVTKNSTLLYVPLILNVTSRVRKSEIPQKYPAHAPGVAYNCHTSL